MKMLEYGRYRLVKEKYRTCEFWNIYFITHEWYERKYTFIDNAETLAEALDKCRRYANV